MKMTVHALAAACIVFASTLLVSCKSGHGPLLINVSGETMTLRIHADAGGITDGECGDQAAVWVGKSGAQTTRVEIKMPSASYVLEREALNTPFGKDETTAFVIEATGPRKLTLREAEVFLRNRPTIARPR